jgi:multiple sugar transport system substrate-binding protein
MVGKGDLILPWMVWRVKAHLRYIGVIGTGLEPKLPKEVQMTPRFPISAALVALLAFSSVAPTGAETFRVWHTESDPRTIEAFESIAKSFEEAHPDVRVELVQIGWDDLYRKLTVAIQSETAPALTQIQPFMAAYLHHLDYLEPLDDVLAEIGIDGVFEVVRDLQLFDGRRYGIATALGISYYSYRPLLVDERITPQDPLSWADFLAFAQSVVGPDAPPELAPLLLPANDLHITLLFTELLAGNGGSLFDEVGRPDFDNPQVLETLQYWQDLFQLIPADYRNSSYSENFTHYAQGHAIALPAFFGRGTLAIERSAPPDQRSPQSFDLLPHPIGPSGTTAYATLDAEPWVILKGSPNPNLAKEFLKFFYTKEQYIKFCASVPIHLTPIFRSLATDGEYTSLPLVETWRPYYDYQVTMLDKEAVLPIFMSRPEDRLNPLLFRLEGSRVVSTMVREVTFGGMSPETSARRAMERASELTEGLMPEEATAKDDEVPAPSTLRYWIILGVILILLLVVWFYRAHRSR